MNHLANETSPYLLQHKNNPVDWFPYSNDAFEKAKKENKLVLISIGYSACHWCHVMERECFENKAVAEIMNKYFVNIKVDREERPDVDQIYMEAIQLMNQQGGWPLNCFTLPDGKPFYGGTYFPEKNWVSILNQLATIYQNDPEKLVEYANNLTLKINEGVFFFEPSEKEFSAEILEEGVKNWSRYFDAKNGGTLRAPKFPLPSSILFLFQFSLLSNNNSLLNHVLHSLHKIAQGGIFDQIGGGFSRYSVDEKWKVPHFEKMLYDNAQLIGLYSEAFGFQQNNEFKKVVDKTIQFCFEELYDNTKGFYCALDADSEGIEGKYYVWSIEELKSLLKDNFELATAYFNFNENGFWEGNYIPLRIVDDRTFAKSLDLPLEDLQLKIYKITSILKEAREKRIKPGLDNKVLTSWNALMISGLCKAFQYISNEQYLATAKKTMLVLLKNHMPDDSLLYRTKGNTTSIAGFLDDYALTIEALILLYKTDLNEFWIDKAKQLTDITLDLFYDPAINAFYFNSNNQKDIIARKIDMHDDVIPSSNSVMAHNLHTLSLIYDNSYYLQVSKKLVKKVMNHFTNELSHYSNWGSFLSKFVFPFREVVITGPKTEEIISSLSKTAIPNTLIIGSTKESSLPIYKDRFQKEQTLIFVCKENTCLQPVHTVKEALENLV